MPDSVLVCCKTILDLAFKPGWDGNYSDFSTRSKDVSEFRRRVQSGGIHLFVPPTLALCAYMMARNYYLKRGLTHGLTHSEIAEKASLCIEILSLGISDLSIDYGMAFSKAASIAISLGDSEITFYEILLLVFADALRIDAVVVLNPQKYESILTLSMLNPSISVMRMEVFLSSWNSK